MPESLMQILLVIPNDNAIGIGPKRRSLKITSLVKKRKTEAK
jgi:hypothetical protein